MSDARTFDFQALVALEPRLAEIERRAGEVRDDGEGSFFCSNFVWLPMYTELRGILGAYRRPGHGQTAEGPLYDSHQFEQAFLYLSKLLPPCRDCGCSAFEPVREAQLRAM